MNNHIEEFKNYEELTSYDDKAQTRMYYHIFDISKYQNFNGSFKPTDEIFKKIGKTKQQIELLATINGRTFDSQFHLLIEEYLSVEPEYRFI